MYRAVRRATEDTPADGACPFLSTVGPILFHGRKIDSPGPLVASKRTMRRVAPRKSALHAELAPMKGRVSAPVAPAQPLHLSRTADTNAAPDAPAEIPVSDGK